jgi:acyl-CoA thioesterase-1
MAAGLAAGYGAAAPAAGTPVILVLGDSLSAEYGLKRGTGWVALLERRLAADRISARLVNASVSGETTSGGRSRLPALLQQHKPTHVVIELGANDALRGLPLDGTEDNLAQMTQAAQKSGARVLLVGMQVPPNYGTAYTDRFGAMYGKVARQHKAALAPFLLAGVADIADPSSLFQSDRIHPTAAAQARMLDNVWPELKKILR